MFRMPGAPDYCTQATKFPGRSLSGYQHSKLPSLHVQVCFTSLALFNKWTLVKLNIAR